MKIRELFEASKRKADDPEDDKPKPKGTKAKEPKVGDDDHMFRRPADQPLARPDKPKTKPAEARPLKTASRDETRRATSGIRHDQRSADHMASIRNIPVPNDEVDAPVEHRLRDPHPVRADVPAVTIANLPAVIPKALRAAGVQSPDFHVIANLPGNVKRVIEILGKAVFAPLTSTPTHKIVMIGNMGGQGPNTPAEVNAVAAYLKKHGEDLGPGEIDFDHVMPGYKAKIHSFIALGARWLLVKDHAGDYIYVWPEHTSTDHAGRNEARQRKLEPPAKGEADEDQKRLR